MKDIHTTKQIAQIIDTKIAFQINTESQETVVKERELSANTTATLLRVGWCSY